jgi:hypothetical protein
MSSSDIDNYDPAALLADIRRAAIAAESGQIGDMLEDFFEAEEDFYLGFIGHLAETRGLVANAQAANMADAAQTLKPEALDDFGTRVEAIRNDGLAYWEGDGATAFRAYLDEIETALQHQYETALTLDYLLRLHGSLVLSAKEGIVSIAEQTVEALEDREQVRRAEEAERLRSLKDNIVNGVEVGLGVGAFSGPWGIVAGVATALGGYVVDEATRVVVGDDAVDILTDMGEAMMEIYENFYEQEAGIWAGLTKLVNAYLTPVDSGSVRGSPLALRYLREYLHGDADPNEVYNKDEWVTF